MTKPLKVACLQMNSTSKLEQNLRFIEQQMHLAQTLGVELIQLPENFAQMPVHRSEQIIESPGVGAIQSFLIDKSKQYQMMVIAGSIPIKGSDNDKPFARCLVFDSSGQQIAVYDKIHLFDVDLPDKQRYLESSSYRAGPSQAGHINLEVVATPLAKLGLTICYDLRFPEMYRVLAAQGVEIIMVPSAFTATTGQAHWRTLLRARAIENQAFVMAAAQVGVHDNGRETWGHSMIIDPWGKVLSEFNDAYQAPDLPPSQLKSESAIRLSSSSGLLIADLKLSRLAELRTNFPALSHRRI